MKNEQQLVKSVNELENRLAEITGAIAAMSAAVHSLIATHPDKTALNQAFRNHSSLDNVYGAEPGSGNSVSFLDGCRKLQQAIDQLQVRKSGVVGGF
ncbi:MAG: hypothetical protein A3I66_01265 [Burkholderiales bacterium RIFCSPLOWO2_02_FULL_57_36]|nr:MAG: hypothetical protein A3I66_01265 [Burkholderiales bacterium RIFCSPLOWO2_02_FULL_57_36]